MEFKGSPDAALAGTYKTKDGRSTYTLASSGDFQLTGKVTTPGGSFDNNVKGSWAVDGDRMLFKYGGNVVPYKLTREGRNLKLALTGSMKNETVLVRQ